jgi:hypothetical protein
VKSPASASQAHSPPVSTGRIRCGDFVATQCSISLFTHGEPAASGEARSTKYREPSIAVWIDDQRPGVTDNPV